MSEARPLPFARRREDWPYAFAFATFALTSFLFDREAALHADLEAQTSFFAQILVQYGKTIDPLVLANPFWLRLMSGISAFVFGPLYLYFLRGFVRGDESIRTPVLIYASAMFYSMVVHVGVEYWGDLPPHRPWLAALTYLPYILLPLALLRRFCRPQAFRT